MDGAQAGDGVSTCVESEPHPSVRWGCVWEEKRSGCREVERLHSQQ